MGPTLFAERAHSHQDEFDTRFADIISHPELAELGKPLTSASEAVDRSLIEYQAHITQPLEYDVRAEKTLPQDEYARSLRAIRILGTIASHEATETSEIPTEAQEALTDFTSAVEENLATDEEYGESLYFNPMRPHEYIGGHTLDRTGRRMTDLIECGINASLTAAENDPEMLVQYERDLGDKEVVNIVDSLEEGELYAVVVMDPKTALKRNPEYWSKRGYREGMAVLQVYYRESKNRMLAGAYAIKDSDLTDIREQMAVHDVFIPVEESENRYVRHGIRKFMNKQEARAFGDKFIEEYNATRGVAREMISTTRIVHDNQSLVNTYFNQYIQPLARAHVSRKSDSSLQQLAASMLNSGAEYLSDERRSLIRVANGLAPSEEDVRIFEEKIRYALVEELRKQVPLYRRIKPSNQGINRVDLVVQHPYQNQQMIDDQVSRNIHAGMQAKRTYGGCSGAGNPQAEQESSLFKIEGSEQDVFSGKSNLSDDKYGSRYFHCPKKGCLNERPKDTLISKCQKCGADVTCGQVVENDSVRNIESKKSSINNILSFPKSRPDHLRDQSKLALAA